ncbi:hypothetical protein [Sphingobacterium sp. T2]|uniref:hypothetical protein n=1 Tax=Sphingobacterium sp. T2 TaxID=1590596 RepID=UPI00057BA9ED|nr:hypothetical protein [Sphingobacterium sp. T2]
MSAHPLLPLQQRQFFLPPEEQRLVTKQRMYDPVSLVVTYRCLAVVQLPSACLSDSPESELHGAVW